MRKTIKQMKKEIDGHTIEVVLNGTGSVDPWSCDFAWYTLEESIEGLKKLIKV